MHKEITKNLLKGNSCRNCKMNIKRFIEIDNCEIKFNVESGIVRWKEPDIGICKCFVNMKKHIE